jgi:hypothetical protein
MTFRLHRISRTALLALVVCAALAAPAAAMPASDDPQPSGARIGDTPADFAQPVAPAPKLGDTPVDYPGASRAVEFEPPRTIEVVRPERTIVRNVDEVLPLVLSGTALLIAFGGAAFLLVGGVRRDHLGRSH